MLQLQLIALYDYVCRYYATQPALHFQRQSNNSWPTFTDQELMTIYLFGLIKERHTLPQTYDYIVEHWADWFPRLPSYQAVNYRLNQIGWHFEPLLGGLCQQLQHRSDLLTDVVLTDSLPIILSRQSACAKVALGLADKGYCATKKLYYHGLKWHVVATDRLARLPLPHHMQLTAGSVNDLSALRVTAPILESVSLVADKAYRSGPFAWTPQNQHVYLHTPVKRGRGQPRIDAADKLYSMYVSRMRQPIESLFKWLVKRVGLQDGSYIRSEKGVWLHCLGAYGRWPVYSRILLLIHISNDRLTKIDKLGNKFALIAIDTVSSGRSRNQIASATVGLCHPICPFSSVIE